MSHALIALGSNLGDREQTLNRAIQMLGECRGIEVVRTSAWQCTVPIGGPVGQSDFLNGAALLSVSSPPLELLAQLQSIESALGRQRIVRWAARSIDLDLLLYDDAVLDTVFLELPHPRMAFRKFVLEPAAQIAGSIVHPTIGWSVSQLSEHLRNARPYIAISGIEVEPMRDLANAIAVKFGWRHLKSLAAEDAFNAESSSGLAPQTAIEFLRKEAALIARINWPADDKGTVSSFWIEDKLAIADACWPGQLDSEWQQLLRTVVPPKLLVMYEKRADENLMEPDSKHPQKIDEIRELIGNIRLARRQRSKRSGIGPVLRLSIDDPIAAETELTAIIQSMSG